jgi:hypothetical protein
MVSNGDHGGVYGTPKNVGLDHHSLRNCSRPFFSCAPPVPRLPSMAGEMATRATSGERFTLTTGRPFADVVGAIERAVAHPNVPELLRKMKEAPSAAALRRLVEDAVGPNGLLEFIRFDFGLVLAKDEPPTRRGAVRFMLGNPLVMRELVRGAPDAGSNAPVSVLVDERDGQVRLAYDRTAPGLSGGDPHALEAARKLDARVEALLCAAAGVAPPA